ncbi:hypothetical protein [Mucilaginibacter lacusdianchii]|uniref:hypothetical protein n=1 Tax=Mucilaginibacter lacusdianchii TaxID=2684211 RepID=UPI00131B8B92|nr:hypothetical protein [Mucilaginibacter sp. JXJ CY 39]
MSLLQRIFKNAPVTNEVVSTTGLKKHVIEFTLWKEDLPLEIQLEPECFIYKVEPGSTLKFVAVTDDYFEWALRSDRKLGGIQLYPKGKGDYEIEIYENGELLKDWFKYMR